MTIRFNQRDAYWVITDKQWFPNGVLDRHRMWDSTTSNRWALGSEMTDESTILSCVFRRLRIQGDEDVEETYVQPCLDRIASMLHLKFNGAKVDAIKHFVDQLETEEEEAAREEENQMRQAGRSSAESAWASARGRVISSKEGYVDKRKKDKEVLDRMTEESMEDAAIEEAVAATLREGQGMVRD